VVRVKRPAPLSALSVPTGPFLHLPFASGLGKRYFELRYPRTELGMQTAFLK
jgi:hypothetical protein